MTDLDDPNPGSGERRYEISALIGPCTLSEAEEAASLVLESLQYGGLGPAVGLEEVEFPAEPNPSKTADREPLRSTG